MKVSLWPGKGYATCRSLTIESTISNAGNDAGKPQRVSLAGGAAGTIL